MIVTDDLHWLREQNLQESFREQHHALLTWDQMRANSASAVLSAPVQLEKRCAQRRRASLSYSLPELSLTAFAT